MLTSNNKIFQKREKNLRFYYSIIKFFEYRRPQRLPVRNENDGGLFPCQAKNRRPAATGPQT
ncbi:MAG: hypothetical protein U9P10_06320, partial [Thermodesulfobacteriota bacterium]|nr:hypothetical protein [Thermodesulfobacteriota bacterium]